MARGSWQLQGLEDYLEAIQKVGRDADRAAAECVDEAGNILKPAIEADAPVLQHNDPRRIKGQLRSTVFRTGVQQEGDVFSVVVGVDQDDAIPYEKFVEFGTARMAAQPYFRPAVDQNRARIKARWRAILQRWGVVE